MDVNPGTGTFPHQPERSWFSRNCFWFLPLILVIVGSPFVCCGGCFMLATRALKAPVDAAVTAVNDDPRVTDKIGTPIERTDSSIVLGNINMNGNTGNANLKSFNVEGPDGRATISGEMKLRDGVWSPERITVKYSDGESIEISDE